MSTRRGVLFENLPLRSKGLLVVLIPLIAIVAAMVMFYQYGQQMRGAQAWVNHTYEVASQVRQLNSLTAAAESGVRGYLLTHDGAFLRPYEAARSGVPERLVTLRRLVSDNPEQTARVGVLEGLARTNMEALDRLYHSSADGASGTSGLLQSSNASMAQLNAALSDMQRVEGRLLAERTARAQQAEDRLRNTVIGGGLIGLFGGVLAALMFATTIEKRVKNLERDARLVAQGRRIETVVTGRDEIAQLEATLVESSRLLSEQREQLRQAQTKLEEKIQQRTTQLREANEELRQANEVRSAIIRFSPLAIWAVDLGGNVTFWNPAAERIFGWAEAEVIGRPLPVIPEELSAEYEEWLRRFRTGETISGEERERIRKDGKHIQVEIWTAPLRDASGRISGTIAIDSDVSGRRLLEEQFRQSQKLEAVGRLAGGVAHDFNNLLTVICGYAETLIDEAQGHPELVDYAQEIQYAGNRAASLTAQLLAFGRRQIIQPRILDLNEVLERSIKLVQRVIGEDIEVVTKLAPDIGKVKVDPAHVDQVLMNLAVNARDAMKDGGRLTIETAETELDEHYTERHIGVAPGRYAMLAISDTGTGMTPEVKSRLFEPFFTTKPVGKGTGLGLSIVYGIVKQNGGEIGVYSEPGKGTTFKIYLPVAEATEEAVPAVPTGAGLRGTETILVCEDEERIRRLVLTVLQKLGYHVLVAGDPREAVQAAQAFHGKIDLLLTDVVMPHGTGLELSADLRRLRPDLKVMYMSGYADHHLAGSRILDEGAAFLQKPFAASVLAQRVKEVLAQSAANPHRSRAE